MLAGPRGGSIGGRSERLRARNDGDFQHFSRLPRLAARIAIVAAGCGGGSTKTATQVETDRDNQPVPNADYIALGDVVCKNHLSRRDDLESQTIDLGRLNSKARPIG
jgi:hypothetical protein